MKKEEKMYRNPYQEGKFIVFEGLDGSGKSLRSQILQEIMVKKGFDVFLTKEPTDHFKEGKKIRKFLKGKIKISLRELQILYTKDRLKHLDKEIIPALAQGKYVISDRYFFSTFAYGFASDIDLKYLYNLNQQAMLPDILIFVETPVKTCLERKKQFFENNDFFEKEEYLIKAQSGYQKSIYDFRDKVDIIRVINGNKESEQMIKNQLENLSKQFKSS